MAGPQFPQQPQGYGPQGMPPQGYGPQGYGQPGMPPQGYYPQPVKKSRTGCIIAVVLVLVLGLGGFAACGGLVLFGLGAAKEEFTQARSVTDDFLKKLSTGDVDGAHALCDSGKITKEQLQAFYTANEADLKGNTGADYTQIVEGMYGNVQNNNNNITMQFSPASLKPSGSQITFWLGKPSGAAGYKITGLVMPKASAGDTTMMGGAGSP